jgi:hypothetical protein
MTARQIIDKAKEEIGVHESPPNSNNVKYNTWFYGHPVQDGIPSGATYPWCAVFISWLFKADPNLCIKTASCANMLAWFEKKGQVVKTPQAGDIVFFKFSTNNRRTNHVGLVVSVSDDGKVINTIEGNTSLKGSQDNGGMVMQRNRYSHIVAYARPKYEGGTLTNITHKKSNEEIAKEVIAGEWGAGNDRRQRLSNAGYDYRVIQDLVNQMLRR